MSALILEISTILSEKTAMPKLINNMNEQILVAIYIAKLKHNILVELPNVKQKSFKIKNNLEGYEFLNKFLTDLQQDCLIVFEPTGNYHRTLAYYLHSKG